MDSLLPARVLHGSTIEMFIVLIVLQSSLVCSHAITSKHGDSLSWSRNDAVSRSLAIEYQDAKIMGTGGQINMTLCKVKCEAACFEYILPGKDECYNPQILFPGDKQWGFLDIKDVCNESHVRRTFFESTNGKCTNKTDVYELPLGECIGPFAKPRPWGIFACLVHQNTLSD